MSDIKLLKFKIIKFFNITERTANQNLLNAQRRTFLIFIGKTLKTCKNL